MGRDRGHDRPGLPARPAGARRPPGPAHGGPRLLRLRRADGQLPGPGDRVERPPRRGPPPRHPPRPARRLRRRHVGPRHPGALLRGRRPPRPRLQCLQHRVLPGVRRLPARLPPAGRAGRRAWAPDRRIAPRRRHRTLPRGLRRRPRDDRLRHHRAAVPPLPRGDGPDPPRHRRGRGAGDRRRRRVRPEGAPGRRRARPRGPDADVPSRSGLPRRGPRPRRVRVVVRLQAAGRPRVVHREGDGKTGDGGRERRPGRHHARRNRRRPRHPRPRGGAGWALRRR